MAKRSHEAQIIHEGMARALWVTSYADWAEENRDDETIDRAGPGEDWEDVSPATPEAAEKAADDLAALFVERNGRTMLQLFKSAVAAIMATGKRGVESGIEQMWKFGWYMAMEALGHGVSWFDDHPQFAVKFPSFEAWFDGDELQWSGGHVSTNPTRPTRPRWKREGHWYTTTVGPMHYRLKPIHEGGRAVSWMIETRTEGVREWSVIGGAPTLRRAKARIEHAQLEANPPILFLNPHEWPSSEIQSLIFDVREFTVAQAKDWATSHGYHAGHVDTTGSYHRLRQEAPQGGPCRTVEFTKGVKAIVCAAGRGLPPGVR